MAQEILQGGFLDLKLITTTIGTPDSSPPPSWSVDRSDLCLFAGPARGTEVKLQCYNTNTANVGVVVTVTCNYFVGGNPRAIDPFPVTIAPADKGIVAATPLAS